MQEDEYIAEAGERGTEAAKTAASWAVDGNLSQEHYRSMVAMFDAGDPEVYDFLPNSPNLSGEWADDLTPVRLYEEITGRDASDVGLSYETEHGWLMDKMADAFEAAVEATFSIECERILREALDPVLDVEHELRQYIETALWSSIDEQPDGSGGPMMDEKYGPDDLAPEALEAMRADLEGFIAGPRNFEDSSQEGIDAHDRALVFWEAELGAGQVGHDFWLTRNGHGAGFWDRFSTGVGEQFGRYLTRQAKPFGESYLYAGDDGKVYLS